MDSKIVIFGLLALVLVTSGCMSGDGAQPQEELENPEPEEGQEEIPETEEESDLERSGDTSGSGESPTEGLE